MKKPNASPDTPADQLSGDEDEDLVAQAHQTFGGAMQGQPATFTADFFARLSKQLDDVDVDGIEEEEEGEEEQSSASGSGIVDVEQGDVEAVCDAAIMTQGMGPCIAVGKTGLFKGRRYSALTHWDGSSPSKNPLDLFVLLDAAIRDKMQEMTGASGPLTEVKHLVVGGRPESATNQQDIHAALGSLGVTYDGILVTPQNTQFAATAESSATISEAGVFSWNVVPEGT